LQQRTIHPDGIQNRGGRSEIPLSGLVTRLGCAALAAGVVACGGEGPAAEQAASIPDAARSAAPGPSTSSYVVIDVVDGGTISGTVRYTGDVPDVRTVAVTNDVEVCGATRGAQSVVLGPEGELANAVVSLIDVSQGADLSFESPPTLDQTGCSFKPHVLLAPAAVSVRVLNSDPLTHNVHTAGFDNRSVNRSQPAGLEVIELNFDVPEKVKVKCDLHPWMNAWIVVIDHPYHAITDDAGAFEISHIPPGTYTMETWHETLGTSRQLVTVQEGETHDMKVDLVSGR
jgi:plastocyanin